MAGDVDALIEVYALMAAQRDVARCIERVTIVIEEVPIEPQIAYGADAL
jgi:hypothetical protein